MPNPPILQVAVPVPIHGTFDYLAPEPAPERLEAGMRVEVPFGRRTEIAYLLGTNPTSKIDPSRLKKATRVLDQVSLLSQHDLDLLWWASRYYHHPIGEVISTAFPVLLRKGQGAVLSREVRFSLTSTGKMTSVADLRRAPRQAALLAWLRGKPEGAGAGDFAEFPWNWRSAVHKLAQKGLIEMHEGGDTENTRRAPADAPLALNDAQQLALEGICGALGTFGAFVLEGVTGSGKTEVYLQLIQKVLERDEQVMVLLPEIALTPQIEARFRARFPVPLALFHSRLNESERLRAWLQIRHGQVSILIGTRSAVFTPLKRPGLIILDEEHDPSYKQQEGFRFSARDVAIMRARKLSIPVVLGSATPSLESILNVEKGRFRRLRLPERAGSARPPAVRLLDIRNRKLSAGLSPDLLGEIERTLGRGEQVLLFLNRRGFAPTLTCHACGWVAECRRCDAHFVVHRRERRLRCHHCGLEQAPPSVCPSCRGGDLRALGTGTERIEAALGELFPEVRVARIDRDTTQRKGSLQNLLADIEGGRTQILLGTQMLAKGHHFPKVTLVGVLDSDAGLYSVDFRAGERLGQLIVQVAGRAGRADKPGNVLLQTRHPHHPLLRSLVLEGYPAFARILLDERRDAMLPPFAYQALVRAAAPGEKPPPAFLSALASLARKAAQTGVEVLGPVPAPMIRRADAYRFQLLIQSPARPPLHALLDTIVPLISKLPHNKRVRWSLDVDPVDLY